MSSQDRSSHTFTSAHLSLPLAIVTVREMGAVNVTFDGVAFDPPNQVDAWSRVRFGELLDALTLGRTRTVRIEVHENDGSVFTDIVYAVRPQPASDGPSSLQTMRRARHRPAHELFEITGSGFIPGEDVTVALVVSSAEGSAGGKARGLVDLSQLAEHRSEIMLIGRVSGVIVSERLPS